MTDRFYTYLLRCNDGSYYAGHTDDIEARLYMHTNGVLQGYTHSRRPVKLVWCESFDSRDEAFQCERQLKGWSRAKKDALIAGEWATLVRLSSLRASDRRPDQSDEVAIDSEALAHPSRTSG